jgi:hypothetical protein
MIMTGFTQRSKSINFFQTTTFFQHRCKFQKYTIDVYTIFSSHFSEGIFCFLCPNSSAFRYVYFQKHKLISAKEKSKSEQQKKRKQKKNMYIIYKELSSGKISFQGLAIHWIGVGLPL